jgi:hypothetical protein
MLNMSYDRIWWQERGVDDTACRDGSRPFSGLHAEGPSILKRERDFEEDIQNTLKIDRLLY